MPTTIIEERSHYTRAEAAKRWQISVRTLDARIASGQVKAVKFGRAVRITAAEVERIDSVGFSA